MAEFIFDNEAKEFIDNQIEYCKSNKSIIVKDEFVADMDNCLGYDDLGCEFSLVNATGEGIGVTFKVDCDRDLVEQMMYGFADESEADDIVAEVSHVDSRQVIAECYKTLMVWIMKKNLQN